MNDNRKTRKYMKIFFVIFAVLFCLNRVSAAQLSGDICDSKAVDQLAMIIFHEVGYLTNDEDEAIFAKLTTGSVALNNASGGTGNTIAEKIQNMTDNQYQGHSTYKYSTITVEAGESASEYIYIAGLVLSHKYNVPNNIIYQIASSSLPGPAWAVVQATYAYAYTTAFGTGGSSPVSVDVFGSNTSTNASDFRENAKTLKLSDYSSYTLDNVCSSVSGTTKVPSTTNSSSTKPIFYMEACENPEILRVIFFGKKIIEVVKIIIPIALIILGMIDFTKSLASNDDNEKKKNIILFLKRILYAVLIFAVPWIVETLMVTLGDLAEGVNFTDCLQNANRKRIDELDEQVEKGNNNNGNNSGNNSSNNDNNNDNNVSKKDFTILVGDSRMVGLCGSVTLKENTDCSVAKGSMGADWFKSTAVTSIKNILEKHPESYIVIYMGTNDLGAIDSATTTYADYEKKLADEYPKAKVVVVSVTPIIDDNVKYYRSIVTDANAVKFNDTLKPKLNSNILYCDIHDQIKNSECNASDGVHYDTNTYKRIYDAILGCLK